METQDKAKSIFLNARRYAKATRLLNQKARTDIEFLLPSFVNAALSLELYFKTLYWLEKNQDFKINGKHSHDFSKLYEQLGDATKSTLSSTFEDFLKNRNMSDVNRIESECNITVPKNLVGNLKDWSDVFVNIRYVYESIGKQISMMFFYEIEKTVVTIIKNKRPDLLDS